jgi:signal transduction histidine kinase
MLGVPLLIQGDVIGVLHVGTLTPRRFTRDDTQLLQMVADRAALGIERARVHDELVRLDRLKTSFVAFAAHELRTPAATVHGLSRALLRLGDDHPEQAAELRASLFEQSERLTRLVEQLLDLSRLDADLVLPEPEAVAARETLAEIAAAAAPGHAREVSVEVDEDSLTVDRQALERVVGNLVANAFRHGAPPVRITVGHRNGTVRIAVEDSGQGVPPQFVPRLFEPFEQHDRSRHAGSGLGLAIARSYARAHGGDLAYEPREPCGSRFVFTLPRA